MDLRLMPSPDVCLGARLKKTGRSLLEVRSTYWKQTRINSPNDPRPSPMPTQTARAPIPGARTCAVAALYDSAETTASTGTHRGSTGCSCRRVRRCPPRGRSRARAAVPLPGGATCSADKAARSATTLRLPIVEPPTLLVGRVPACGSCALPRHSPISGESSRRSLRASRAAHHGSA